MREFAKWFTTERRQAIQAALGTIAPLAIMLGFGTTGTWEQIGVIGGAALGSIAGLLNLLNVRVRDWATKGWAIVRGVIYSGAFAVSPALVALGFYNDEVNAQITTGISLGLTALSSLIGIFAASEQQKVAFIAGKSLRRDLN